jgi:hypothetical protein
MIFFENDIYKKKDLKTSNVCILIYKNKDFTETCLWAKISTLEAKNDPKILASDLTQSYVHIKNEIKSHGVRKIF